MSRPTPEARPSWFLLNLTQEHPRPLTLRGGGPPLRAHISAARVLSTEERLLVTLVDTQAPAMIPLRHTHERFGPIVAANLLEGWVAEHGAVTPSHDDLPGILTVFGPDNRTVVERYSLAMESKPDSETVNIRLLDANGRAIETHATRWWIELRRAGHRVLIDQWASTTRNDAWALLAHTVKRLQIMDAQLPNWPALAVEERPPQQPAEFDKWFVFHKRESRVNTLSIPQRNPYRTPVLLLGRSSSLPPQVTLCETTHAWFDPHETASQTGTAVRGDAALECFTAATAGGAAGVLFSALGKSEFLVSVVNTYPTAQAGARSAPQFRPDLVAALSPEWQLRDGIPVLAVPIFERPEGGYTVRGQNGTLEWQGDPTSGTALLVAIAHPDGQRYVVEYVIRMQGGELLHDLLQTIARVAELLGFNGAPGFSFADTPVVEIEPRRRGGGQVVGASDRTALPDDEPMDDSFACQERTFERARRILPSDGDDRESAAERLHALDQLVQSVLRDPDEHSRISRLLRQYRLSADEILATRQGRMAVSLIVAEMCVETTFPVLSAIPGPRERADLERLHALVFDSAAPVDVFADALTSFLRAQVTDHAQTRARAVSRIINLASEWLLGQQQRPHHAHMALDARSMSGNQLAGLRELLQHAPWLAMYVNNRTGPRRIRIRLDPTAFLEVMGLVRPRTKYVPGANSASSNPGNWRSVSGQVELSDLLDRYVLDDQIVACLTEEPRLLDDLARACEVMYHLPWQARRAVQSLTELGRIADQLDALVGRGVESRMGALDDVSVVIDSPGGGLAPRICLVNADSTRRCQVAVGEKARFSIAEFAVDVPDAAAYMTAPLTLPPDAETITVQQDADERHVRLGVRGRLDEGSGADTEWVDPVLFRGRHEQLNQILGIMHPSSAVRVPVALYGPRGAGKTTLAVHACRQGVRRGWLSAFTKVDLFGDPVGSEGEAYLDSLTEVLVEKAEHELGIVIAGSPADPAAALDEIDRASAGVPVGIVLDEFDRLLSHAADSPLQRLAIRLGGKRWQNLTVIATVQRFYRNVAELETWQLIGCPADLSWRDGVTYFAQPLLEIEQGQRDVAELRAPVVLPIAFRDSVHRRLALRPYYWGRLRRQLESALLMTSGYAIADFQTIDRIIDGFIDANQYLGQPLQESAGVSLSEARRRDLFSLSEKRILACFATSERKRLAVAEAVRVGGADGVWELQERAYAVVRDDQLQLAVPLYGEYLRAHALEFDEYVNSA